MYKNIIYKLCLKHIGHNLFSKILKETTRYLQKLKSNINLI